MPVWLPGDTRFPGSAWNVTLTVKNQATGLNDAVSTYSAATAAVPLTVADREQLDAICRDAHHAMMRVFEGAWANQSPRATVVLG